MTTAKSKPRKHTASATLNSSYKTGGVIGQSLDTPEPAKDKIPSVDNALDLLDDEVRLLDHELTLLDDKLTHITDRSRRTECPASEDSDVTKASGSPIRVHLDLLISRISDLRYRTRDMTYGVDLPDLVEHDVTRRG